MVTSTNIFFFQSPYYQNMPFSFLKPCKNKTGKIKKGINDAISWKCWLSQPLDQSAEPRWQNDRPGEANVSVTGLGNPAHSAGELEAQTLEQGCAHVLYGRVNGRRWVMTACVASVGPGVADIPDTIGGDIFARPRSFMPGRFASWNPRTSREAPPCPVGDQCVWGICGVRPPAHDGGGTLSRMWLGCPKQRAIGCPERTLRLQTKLGCPLTPLLSLSWTVGCPEQTSLPSTRTLGRTWHKH